MAQRVLASFCNNHNPTLAIVTERDIERVIKLSPLAGVSGPIGVTGLASSAGYIFAAIQSLPPAIVVLSHDLDIIDVKLLHSIYDIHGIAAVGQTLFIVSTGANQLCSTPLSFDRSLVVEFQLGMDACDRHHLNDVEVVEGRPIVSMFGARRYGTLRSGIVYDIDARKPILRGIREPHSPQHYNGMLYVLESATGDLYEHRAGLHPRRVAGFIGYPRGLSVSRGGYAVGVSGFRTISRGTIGNSRSMPLEGVGNPSFTIHRSWVYFLDPAGNVTGVVDMTECGLEIYHVMNLSQ